MLKNFEHFLGIENMGSEKDMRWAMKIQSETHFSNIADIENESVSYDWKTAKNMIVHTRDDVVLLNVYNAIIAGRLSNISFYLRLITIILGILLYNQIYN
jgi:hypothetical protein